ncbi:hypothetical protein ACWD25_19655 [Streptomyces sp. NPDC002920]
MWDLEGERRVHHYLKVSPSAKFFTRESRAYRHIVLALGHTRAPHLIDSRAQDLALLLTAVPGALVLFLGVRGTLAVGAVLQIVPVVLLLVSPVRALRDMPVPPARTTVPPAREGAS